jgi:hypothetical protein
MTSTSSDTVSIEQHIDTFCASGRAILADGIAFARRDDPNGLASACRLLAAGNATAQLVVSFGDPLAITLRLVDTDQQPIADLFTYKAAPGKAQ